MQNGSFIGVPNDFGYLLLFRVVDQYGVPVVNTPVSFQILAGGGSSTRRAAIRLQTHWAPPASSWIWDRSRATRSLAVLQVG